jgi:polyisoprenyl-phosphate glycosyltransferase
LKLSIVVPTYQCTNCLSELTRRVDQTLTNRGFKFELIFVQDEHNPQSWQTISGLAQKYPFVRGFRLSRNFGQHMAITAGLRESRGELVVVMDCDLQDPPELIPQLMEKISEGHDIVLTRRKGKKHSLFKRLTAWGFNKVITSTSQTTLNQEYGSFSILTRPVVESFLMFSEKDRHYLFILDWVGFNKTSIEYDHQERFAGKGSYDFVRLLRHAVSGVFFQTTQFLNFIVYVGVVINFIGIIYGLLILRQYFTTGLLAGWASTNILILLVGGSTIFTIGTVGLYVGRIFDEIKKRPNYIIKDRIN